MEGKTSVRALVVTWVSIPSVFIIFFVFTYLPQLLCIAFSKAVREGIMEALGVTEMGQVDISSYIFEKIFGWIPDVVLVLISIPIVMLILAWLGWCLVLTYRHFQYCLAVTDFRVIGKAAGEELDSPLNEVINVFVEQSIWGRLLHYGSLVVQTKRKSLTFRNLHDPEKIHHCLMSYASDYCAH